MAFPAQTDSISVIAHTINRTEAAERSGAQCVRMVDLVTFAPWQGHLMFLVGDTEGLRSLKHLPCTCKHTYMDAHTGLKLRDQRSCCSSGCP